MKTTTTCPQTEELRQLIDGTMSGDRQQECVAHLDSCESCAVKLEEVATGSTNLSQVVKQVREEEPMATSAYWPALRALDGNNPRVATRPSVSRSKELTLSFLQPSTDAAYLGRLSHFDVMRVIGRGGMGIVLEAFDSKLQRHVALKVLDPELADDELARQRFCREARAAASITHENVVAVHQVERSDNEMLPYLVMQLVDGESLDDRLARQKKLPIREVVRIGMQAAHGLAAAHAQGLIHRDIKPGNILLEPPGDRVKLTDFGLARVADDVKLTRTGFVTGTPLYMAPEQALGEEPDPRSDLFSLGAILYEMCAGEPPFRGNSALMILRQITESKHRPLREVDPSLPEWLTETIERLLAKKPSDRIQSAAHLAELFDFEWALMKTTSEDVPTVCQEEERKAARRNRIIAVAVGATFLAVGLLGGWLMASRQPAGPAAVSSAEPSAVLNGNAGAVWSVSFNAQNDTIAMAVEDGSVRLWDLPARSVKATLNAHRGTVWSTAFSHQGNTLATAGDDGAIKIWDLGQPEPVKTFSSLHSVRSIAFSKDDQRVYSGDRNGELRTFPITGDAEGLSAQQPGSVHVIALSPNGETLATGGSDKIVRLWNAKTLSQRLPLEAHNGPIYGLSFSEDGSRLASVGWDKSVRIWDVASGQLLKTWEAHSSDIWTVAFSPSGNQLVTGGTDGAVKLWNSETGELLSSFLGHNIAVHTVAFSHDGHQIASGGRDGNVRIWNLD